MSKPHSHIPYAGNRHGELNVSVVLQGMAELDGELMATGMTVTNLDHLIKILKFQMLEKGKDVCGTISVFDEDSFMPLKSVRLIPSTVKR